MIDTLDPFIGLALYHVYNSFEHNADLAKCEM